MSSPALQRLPAPSAPPAPPPPPPSRPPAQRRAWQRRAWERRILLLAILASVLVHGLVLFVSRYLITFVEPYGEAQPATTARRTTVPGIRVYRIEPVARATATPEEQVARPLPEEPAPAAPPAEAEEAPGAEAAGEAAPRNLSPAERLRPADVGDPRLWAPLPWLVERPASPAEAARENLYGRLEEWSDSMALEADAARRAMDWTIKGEDGKRWGISPEGIHLGGITLPAPVLGPAAGSEAGRRSREWTEIQGQADRARIRDRFNDRAKAIRERKDKERQESKQGQQGSGQGQQGDKKPPS